MGTTIRKKLTASVIAVLTVLNFMLIPVSAAEGEIFVSSWTDLKSAVAANSAVKIVLENDITISSSEAALAIGANKDITLDLNGKKIERESVPSSVTSFITVQVTSGSQKAKLTLTDSSEAKTGMLTGGSRGVAVGRNGEFIMEDGNITGNDAKTANGGGVWVVNGGSFTMKGGKITNNSANNGGGVDVENGSTFILINGLIDGNTARELGGGMRLNDGSSTTLYGGTITNNIAIIDDDTNMERGAGIYFGHQAEFNFGSENSGITMNPIIVEGNKDQIKNNGVTELRDDNLYISMNNSRTHVIHINQELAEGTSIGLCVSFYNNATDVSATVGYFKSNGTADPNGFFFLDQANRSLVVENGEIHCVNHQHILKYEIDKDDPSILHVTCDGNINTRAKCPLQTDLQLVASDTEYTGNPVEASLKNTVAFERVTGIAADNADIKYYDANDESTELTSAPVKAGNYIAKYTVTADKDYTIVKAFAITCVNHQLVFENIYWTEKTGGEEGYTAEAVYKCSGCEEEVKVEAEVTSKTTPATCVKDGEIEYTATVAAEKTPDNTPREETKTVTIPHGDHKYVFTKFDNWTKNDTEGYDVDAIFTCENNNCDSVNTVKVTATETARTNPTCTDEGSVTYTASVTDDEGVLHTEDKTDSIDALGHEWGKVTYSWVQDGDDWKCTATRVCSRDSAHEDTETVIATHETTTAATCEGTGVETYTATFTNTELGSDTKEVSIPATGHDWEYVDFTWTEDKVNGGFTAVANYVCKNDSKHTQTVDATVTSEKTDPTCEDGGKIVYTAVVDASISLDKNECKDTLTVDIDPDGHVWEFVDFTWTDAKDGFTAKANYVCKTDDSHKKSVDAKVESKTTDATCEKDGQTVYTATVDADASLDKKAQSDTKTVVIPATGHDWEDPTYTWSDDNSTVTAKRVCKNDKTHVEEETVKTTSKITKDPSVGATGVRTFTSDEFKNPAFKVQTKNIDLAKLTPTPTTPADDPSVKLKINKSSITLACGKTDSLKASLVGAKADITWKSSNPKIATVDANGKITAKMAGSVTITASAVGKKATCTVQVLFKDVTNNKDFWYTPTYYMTDKNVVKGYDNQTMFKPANICTRAQMVTFIWRLVGQPAPKTTSMKFKDVKKSDYFYQACLWGNENHIVEGYKDGTFGPKINCARRHAVTFLWRLAGKPNPKTTKNKFSDLKKSDYYYKATLWASEMKILEGYNDGTFRPNGDCLRRQMVTFLYKYDKFINKKG